MNIDEIVNELDVQTSNLQVLQECLNHINTVMQSTDTFDNPRELTELLKDVKTNLDNTRNNISRLEQIKNQFSTSENISSNNIDFELINRIYEECTC